MKTTIELLDCTLRDGAYITGGGNFGAPCIRGIIHKNESANIDIIECGWLKNDPYREGSTYYHLPDDLRPYLSRKDPAKTYVVMIDWDRYEVASLPPCDGNSIDAVRVVFPTAGTGKGSALRPKSRQRAIKCSCRRRIPFPTTMRS